MRKRLLLTGAALVALVGSMLVAIQPAHAAVGFHVSGGRLLDANGNDFIMRGVNHAHTWYPTQTSSFANIKALGANTVRVVLSTGGQWTKNDTADVTNVINLCKQNRLICVLEAHDTTGYGEAGAAVSLNAAADYWISVQSALTGQERYVILNIGNEPYGNTNYTAWTADTTNAIRKLRAAGFQHTIMVDGPNWGQDWSFTMRDNAAAVFAADTSANTVFSIHMYGVFDTAAEISSYLNAFVNARLPIVVGEFGHNHSDGNPDEDAILATTQSLRLGYLGWSWSGNGGGVEYLDLVTGFNASSLTSWGTRLFNGTNGIRQTSREASVYSGTSPSPGSSSAGPSPSRSVSPSASASASPSRSPSPSAGGGGRTCTATYAVQNQWPGGFQGDVKVTAGGTSISGWTVTWTFANGQTISSSWGATLTTSGSTVTGRNMSYNGNIAAGASINFGFIGSWNGTNGAPTASCVAS